MFAGWADEAHTEYYAYEESPSGGAHLSQIPYPYWPGYGTFTEAACNGTPVIYQRRKNRPEQDCLIEWLISNSRCVEIEEEKLLSGRLAAAIDCILNQTPPPAPKAGGIAQAAKAIIEHAGVQVSE